MGSRLLPSKRKLFGESGLKLSSSRQSKPDSGSTGHENSRLGSRLSMTSSNIYMAATANVLSSLRLALVGWSKALANEVAKDGYCEYVLSLGE